ncbi:MAG TPA: GNAT family N-acetyltransferase [Anaeromyxobacter sp.]
MRPHPFERVLAPRAVAVFGAGDDGSVGGRMLRNLASGGFAGAIHAIGGGAGAVPGVRSHESLAEVDGPVDLAVVATPLAEAPAVLRACAERGVSGAVLPVGVSPDAHRGGTAGAFARELAAEARRSGMRLVGPNSIGIVRTGARLNATFTRGSALSGSLALVSQSGAICATVLDWAAAHRIGFSTVVSLGDAADVDFGDVLEYLALDPETRSILLHVETIRSARSFLSGLRIAARLKPVIVVKAGRRAAGGARAASSDEAFDAALARAGAVRVSSIERMFAAAQLLAARRTVAGNRLAIVANARGPALLAADRAGDLGVAVPRLGVKTRGALDAALPAVGSHENPVDLLGDADPARYRLAVEACLADENVDVVLAMLAPQALANPVETAHAVLAASRGAAKPVVACWMGEELVHRARAVLEHTGIPQLATPERAVEAVHLLASYRRNQRLLTEVPGPVAPDAMPQLDLARELIGRALAAGRDTLTTAELRKLLATVGVRDRAAAGERVAGAELYLGVGRDGVFGPVLRFGLGGSGGLRGAPVVSLPPFNTAIIDTLVQTSGLAGALSAGAAMAEADVAAVKRTLWAVSELVSELPEIVEVEVAPLVAHRGEVYASSARLAIARPPPGAGRYDHMAIHPYPSAMEARWELPGGGVAKVRPIRPEDAQMEASFVRNLSDDARHFRFMVGLRELPRDMLIRFTQIDYDRELALVVVVEQGGADAEIAVARYVMAPDGRSASIAIVVADEWQRRGIGARLFGTLIDAARARGIERLDGEMLAQNAAVRALVTRFGFTIRTDPESADICLIEKTLV